MRPLRGAWRVQQWRSSETQQSGLCPFFYKNFRETFAIFSQVFRRFRKFFEVFGLVRTCSDLLRCARIHSDAFGCIQMRSDAFGHVRKISVNFDEKIGFFGISTRFLRRLRTFDTKVLNLRSKKSSKYPQVKNFCTRLL